QYRSLHGEAGVPPQLQIEIRGEVVPPPGRLKPEELASEGPKISLLCPVFKPQFLADMLRSVLQQTWRNWELLILVDGPPEEDERRILEILSRVRSEPRIRFRLGENRGTGPCRQSLAEEAAGDFLLSIDDDDLLPAHALEVFASAVRQHPEAKCFRGGTQLVGLVEEYLRPRRRLVVAGISGDPFEVSQPFLVARETLAEIGGFEGDPALRNAGEDTWLFHKLDRAGVRTLILDEPLYLRRLSQDNLSLDFDHQEVLGHFRNLERRFCPPGWASADRHNELAGGFQQSIVTWRRQGPEQPSGQEVVTATRFFQYKTLGEESLAAIDLELTSICNAVCTFCPREVMPDKSSFLPLDVVQALAAQLAQEPKPRQVVLCGIGESTLHPELTTIIQLLSQAGARVCMTTNGSRLDAELFRRWIDCGLKELNVSLNAATAETHFRVMRLRKFAQIKEGLLQALDLKHRRYPHIRVHASFVLCSLNQDEVHAFVDEWRPTPVSQIWLHPINNRAGLLSPEAGPVDLEPLARRYAGDGRVVVDIFKHHPEDGHLCKIARSMDFISVDGRLRLCAMDYERKTDYGDVRHGRLRHLYLEKILSYRRGETLSLCQGCDFHPGRAAAIPTTPQEMTVGLADVRP
ncbi:MAG TPA: radical SAM protein, partial [Thermoanaerobaculia bacterium]|nr:radical SAM protein [Thermoanaerobaculia bacterium]